MDEQRHTLRCAAYALIIKANKILLLLRRNTGWMDGYYGLPAGHLEKGESITGALVREVHEEVGIKIKPENLKFVHVMHRHEMGNFEYIDFFFLLMKWQGDPINNEPEKAANIKWFDLELLPKNIVPNVKAGIDNYKNRKVFSDFS
ncbi:MAG: NUDIX domain-containing protein [Candidatus Levyibacteriota bacterium]|jgi:8-oxo-dGTP pyrophosphatase MutT (NUDIX family)